ncbi:MAG: M15 family metallopeptidase [Cyanobacteria bacterium P01_E01_bin.6]
MKLYQQIPIQDCGEPLVPISSIHVTFVDPHPYVILGAPYGNKSPYYLRQGIHKRLITAQTYLQQQHPNWQIQIFDAYRPITVQQFMVHYAYRTMLRDRGIKESLLSMEQKQTILEEVYQFWAVPSHDPKTPPPHSTGAAIDVTLVDAEGVAVDMGSPIDEISLRSYPDYFAANSPHRLPIDDTPVDECDRIHQNRQLLNEVMSQAGFLQHPNEWWHFSFGDQLWAWLTRTQAIAKHAECAADGEIEELGEVEAIARYGRI